ncbi:hypothetical protein OAA90_00370 [Salibacteraceae bacterium]|nr:hypothetical protein [Salibacteraceae bacterium]MDA9968139.1 hypothetical protein [Salibacteraceae bacterium]MDB9724815.1 hypothetical protein [Salibacteraceae bacterium]
MHRNLITLLILVSIVLAPSILDAQCSMCKLMAENSYKSGSEIGRGLNGGIMYIMGIPYILILVGGFVLFRKNFGK